MEDYTIIVNTFDGSLTGHVNITLTGPGGWTHTFGNNTTDGSWGVREEFNDGRTDMHSTTYPATYEQVMDMYDWVADVMGDPNNSYGLLGRNCVDFVRDMFSAAGLGNQVSHLMQWLDEPVNYYAAITDWLDVNGFGGIMNGIGAALGAVGELGSLMLNAAESAWDWASDMVDNAWGFVDNLGDSIGGFFGDLGDAISDFFSGFGDHGGGGLGENDDTIDARAAGDDFVLNSDFELGLSDAPALAFSGPWSDGPTVAPLFSPANDPSPFDAGYETACAVPFDDYAFA